MNSINRREFVGLAAAAWASCVFQPVTAAEPAKPVDIGSAADYAKDGVYDQWAGGHRFFVVREKDRVYAISSVCTHKQAMIAVNGPDRGKFRCAKHGSEFSRQGVVAKGPANRGLQRLGISYDQQKRIIVNPAQLFEQANWNAVAAFVKVG